MYQLPLLNKLMNNMNSLAKGAGRNTFGQLKRIANSRKERDSSLKTPLEGYPPPSQDTAAAIAELSRVVKDNPEAIEIYLALGNLYRAQGDIERAIKIRNNLIVRPHLQTRYKGRILYELGMDYKRGGFLDRAQETFQEARQIVGDDPAIIEEMASLAASDQDFEKAARYYKILSKPVAEAHYYVQLSKLLLSKEETEDSEFWLKKALSTYPASIEAWLEKMIRSYNLEKWDQLANNFKKGLTKVESNLRFILLEGLIDHLIQNKGKEELFSPVINKIAADKLIKTVHKQPPDILLYYYGAWLLIQLRETENANKWLYKCRELSPDFWPARLESLALCSENQPLDTEFKEHLDYFFQRARQVKKFICSRCGLKREKIFFVCPRCRSWYSISFLKSLTQ